MFAGALPTFVIAAVAPESASIVPSSFFAVTATRSVRPTSLEETT